MSSVPSQVPTSSLTQPRLRAGLIGCGRMGQYHLHALRAAPSLELVALADPSEDALRAAGEAADVPVERRYRDYEEMLRHASLDFVDVATQAPLHAPASIAAAKAGVRAVLCEKPVALELAEADQMIEACDRAGSVLAINHTLRQSRGALEARRMIAEGAIGEPLSIHFWDKGGRPAGVAFMEMGTHVFDLARFLGGEAVWVSAHLWNVRGEGAHRLANAEDVAPSRVAWPRDRDCGPVLGDRGAITFMLASQTAGETRMLPAFYEAHFLPTGPRWRTVVVVHGTEGSIAVASAAGGSATECFVARHAVDVPPHYEPVVTGEDVWFPRPDGFQDEPIFDEGFTRQLIFTLEETARAAREGVALSSQISSGRDGCAALEMIMGIYESHLQDGRRIALPLARRTHPLREPSGATQ